MSQPIRQLRWWIAGALFLSTVINYLDRQTLSVLAPYIKAEFHWNNQMFAWMIIAFRLAYAIGQSVSGRLLDRIGLRRALPLAVGFYSCAAIATSLTTGFGSLAICRFCLGAGESANWPGAAKTVAEWFPRRESGWAVAIFDSGCENFLANGAPKRSACRRRSSDSGCSVLRILLASEGCLR